MIIKVGIKYELFDIQLEESDPGVRESLTPDETKGPILDGQMINQEGKSYSSQRSRDSEISQRVS